MQTSGHIPQEEYAGEEFEILELEEFDTAFAVSAGQNATVRRRFMTLFVNPKQTRLYGSSGTVNQARNAHGEVFAIKRLHSNTGVTPTIDDDQPRFSDAQLAAFYEEYRTQLQLSHMKGFPRLYGYGKANGDPVIIMEWVEGTTLAHAKGLLPRHGNGRAVNPRTVAQVGRDLFSVLEALDMLAERPVHRDLSPTNIMIRTSNRTLDQQIAEGSYDICLIDFGSATVVGSPDPRLTMAANVWRNGTPEYAPPEMLTLDAPGVEMLRQSPSIDVYAASSVLYELLSASTPFRIAERSKASPYRIKMDNEPYPLDADYGALGAAIMGGIRAQQSERLSASTIKRLCIAFLDGQTADTFNSQQFSGALPNAIPKNFALQSQQPQGNIPPVADFEMAHLSMPDMRTSIGGVAGGANPYSSGNYPERRAERQKSVTRRNLVIGGAILIGAITLGATVFGVTQNTGKTSSLLTSAGSSASSGGEDANAVETAEYTGGTLYAAQDAKTMLWGFLNSGRKWVIEPRFAVSPGLFSEGLACAVDPDTNLSGFIDYTGAWAIEPQFSGSIGTGFSSEGLACVVSVEGHDLGGGQANRAGWIGKDGKWVIPPKYLGGGMFKQGLAGCTSKTDDGGKNVWGYVDKSGSFVIPESFGACGAFSDNGLALVKGTPVMWGYIDKSGQWAIEPKYARCGSFHEDLAAVCDPITELWGFVNAKNETIIQQTFSNARFFSDGRAACQDKSSGLWGMIDKEGKWVMQPKFLALGELSHGLAPAQDDSTKLYGYVDDQGEWVIPPQFADVGLAAME